MGEKVIFEIWGQSITLGDLISLSVSIVFCVLLYAVVVRRILPWYFSKEKIQTPNRSKVIRGIRYLFLLLVLFLISWHLKLDETLNYEPFNISLSKVLIALIIWQLARLLDWVISKVILFNYYQSRPEDPDLPIVPTKDEVERTASRLVQYTVYVCAAILILRNFSLDYRLFTYNDNIEFKVSKIFIAILILLIAQLITWILVQIFLQTYYRKKDVDKGARYAISQLISYVVYVAAVLMALESLGIQMTVLWGGAAALLVGVGLGLQQTFNDFFSGIIILFERSVEVGDWLEVEGMIGVVKKIGLRTSLIDTWDNISVILPNSKLTTERVINWSHYDKKVRFKVTVGVAYGSDTQKVKSILMRVARQNHYVLGAPEPFVRLIDFGDSSLDFELHFWTKNLMGVEDIKSDLRFEIDRAFRENQVHIPFPQRDLWFRNSTPK